MNQKGNEKTWENINNRDVLKLCQLLNPKLRSIYRNVNYSTDQNPFVNQGLCWVHRREVHFEVPLLAAIHHIFLQQAPLL